MSKSGVGVSDKWERLKRLRIKGERLKVRDREDLVLIVHEIQPYRNRALAFTPLFLTGIVMAVAGPLAFFVYPVFHFWLYPSFPFEQYVFGNLRLAFYADAIVIDRAVDQWIKFRPHYPRAIMIKDNPRLEILPTGVVGIVCHDYFEPLFLGYDPAVAMSLAALVEEAARRDVTQFAPSWIVNRKLRFPVLADL